jgi:hypothetical protein
MSAKRPQNSPAWKKVVLDFVTKIAATAIVQVIKDLLS